MKTPKRTYTPNFLEYGDEYYGIHSQRKKETFSRWKRKNKIKQLKRSLQRYKRIEHLPFYTPIWHACRLMLDLKRPGKNADLNEYNLYFQQLDEISIHLCKEMRRIGITAGEKLATSSENKEKTRQ